jgi:tetratricopeptide (TPR) repeat protein
MSVTSFVNFTSLLAVDDDVSVLNQVRRTAMAMGFQDVVTCEDATRALQVLNSDKAFQIALIDLRMPTLTGSAILQVIKNHSNDAVRLMPLLVMMGPVNEAEIRILSEFHISQHVTKPCKDKDLEKAIHDCLQIHTNLNNDEVFFEVFETALQEKDFKKAIEMLEPKLKGDPKSVKYNTLLAKLHFVRGNVAKAGEILKPVLLSNSEYPLALNLAAKICVKTGKYAEAVANLERAQKVSPLNIQRLIAMGEMHLAAGKIDEAEGKFRKALEFYPTGETAKIGLSRVLIAQGRMDDAQEILKDIEDKEEVASYFNMRGVMLIRAKRFDEAVDLYDKAMRALLDKEKEYLLIFNMALGYKKKGELAKAKLYAQKCLDKAPGPFEKATRLLESIEKAEVSQAPIEVPETPKEGSLFLFTPHQLDFLLGDQAPDGPDTLEGFQLGGASEEATELNLTRGTNTEKNALLNVQTKQNAELQQYWSKKKKGGRGFRSF